MIQSVYTVYDSKAEAYLVFGFYDNNALAIREFQGVCNNPQSNISQHPADYTLFEVATYDRVTGKFESLPAFVNLGNALSYVTKEN